MGLPFGNVCGRIGRYLFSGSLGTARDDLDSIGHDSLIVEFKGGVFQNERPNLVARSVRIQTSLEIVSIQFSQHDDRDTLKDTRLFTLPASSSEIALSNWTIRNVSHQDLRCPIF